MTLSCKSSPSKIEKAPDKLSQRLPEPYLANLYRSFTGQAFKYVPGSYKRDKIYAFIIDRHNAPFENDIIRNELIKNNLWATDTIHLRTVALIYSNAMPLDLLIGQKKVKSPEPGFHICFVDLESMEIRKVTKVKCSYYPPENYPAIASKIIQEF